jgi:hypothetical protein
MVMVAVECHLAVVQQLDAILVATTVLAATDVALPDVVNQDAALTDTAILADLCAVHVAAGNY